MTQKKLWEKEINVDQRIEQFTVGKDRELDMQLASFDVIGSMAHIRMLNKIGLLNDNELSLLQKNLRKIYQSIQDSQFSIEEGIEDIHSQVEILLTNELGEIGKKIHAGRSRNDQVLVDLKLFTRDKLYQLVELIKILFNRLIELSEKFKDILLPGYTHMQVAMPSSFGLWFGAYAESLVDDLIQIEAAYKIVNKNPLGSAAGFGSSFPLDRKTTTELLGFGELNYNSVYAQMNRGKMEGVVSYAIASVAATLAKLSADIILYLSQNFSFISFPDQLTTGSSIMPHKKNPDVFEIMRAKCNRILALPNEISMITNNLTSGYHRDFQMLKESFLPALTHIIECTGMMHFMLEHIQINKDILSDAKYNYLFSVEAVNKKVIKGVPFREAYRDIGIQIEQGNFKPDVQINHTHEGSIGNLCNNQIKKMFNEVLELFNFDKYQKAIKRLLEA
ncbi:MAG: argininosuccinate lyase [Calditrichaceae bacterium]|nr:argininosuccinate lyase [Calditrichaceae bacterium]